MEKQAYRQGVHQALYVLGFVKSSQPVRGRLPMELPSGAWSNSPGVPRESSPISGFPGASPRYGSGIPTPQAVRSGALVSSAMGGGGTASDPRSTPLGLLSQGGVNIPTQLTAPPKPFR